MLLSIHDGRFSSRLRFSNSAAPIFANTIVQDGNTKARRRGAVSCETIFGQCTISISLPSVPRLLTLKNGMFPDSLPCSSSGNPTPACRSPTLLRVVTAHCAGISPSHSTPESLYSEYGRNGRLDMDEGCGMRDKSCCAFVLSSIIHPCAFITRLHVREHVLQKEELAVRDARQPGSACGLRPGRSGVQRMWSSVMVSMPPEPQQGSQTVEITP